MPLPHMQPDKGGAPPHQQRRPRLPHTTTTRPPRMTLETAKANLAALVDTYMKTHDILNRQQYELEVKFGTRGVRSITKQDYHNVVEKLKSLGFVCAQPGGTYSLRIQTELTHTGTGHVQFHGDSERFRVEIDGFDAVQEYCRTDNLGEINQKNPHMVRIVRKSDVALDAMTKAPFKTGAEAAAAAAAGTTTRLDTADFDDFNFRVALKVEDTLGKNGQVATDLFQTWPSRQKIFRYMNRVSFTPADTDSLPFRFDLSIVRSSSQNTVQIQRHDGTTYTRKQWKATRQISESNVFQNPETFELEIEVLPMARIQYANHPGELMAKLQTMAKYVLCGLQRTNFPVGYSEQEAICAEYMTVLHETDFYEAQRHHTSGEEGEEGERVFVAKTRLAPGDFLGPSSKALQRKNIVPITADFDVPNITAPYSYCVTDKADGERHLLFVSASQGRAGRIYMIDMRMNVIFTGAQTDNPQCFGSILDGEFIAHDKAGKFIHLYAAFDVYYIRGVDVRARPFMQLPLSVLPEAMQEIERERRRDAKTRDSSASRLQLLQEWINVVDARAITAAPPAAAPRPAVPASAKKDAKEDRALAQARQRHSSPITLSCKNFYPEISSAALAASGETEAASATLPVYNIFESCKILLERIRDGMYPYETDGLIFTPTMLGVGAARMYEAGAKRKITWDYSFKWKPSEKTPTFPNSYNTIDFLVTTKKNADNSDVVTPLFERGVNNNVATQFNQYKTLVLAVGFDEKRHGYMNPCHDLLMDKYPTSVAATTASASDNNSYQPKQFYPSDPADPSAGLCNIMLELDANGEPQMFAEDRDTFTDQTIVEFRYDRSSRNKSGLWRWVPLRVRHDKTAEFRQGYSNYGNDYTTANDNWYSIHYPVTEDMITTGAGIPTVTAQLDEDVYYYNPTQALSSRRGGDTNLTRGMRDFHNLYVKRALILGVSKPGDTLIDLACGKGGDFPKWISAQLSFVFGIDLSKDNLENRLNGACARYLNYRREFKRMPYALFVNGNSALNIRSGDHMFSEKGKEITRAVFGQTGRNRQLEPAVVRQYGKGVNGFDVCSCQFAMHYMFKNADTFYPFVQNIAECTKRNGYFIATCYDGHKMFNLLNRKQKGDTVEIVHRGTRVWSVTKNYAEALFEDNESSLGYEIGVYQDSIGQTLSEYLVNFEFFKTVMSQYGFDLLGEQSAAQLGLPRDTGGSGMFEQMFVQMQSRSRGGRGHGNPEVGDALRMQPYEKDISFLNRYFVFQKTRDVNAAERTREFLHNLPMETQWEEEATEAAVQDVRETQRGLAQKRAAHVRPIHERLVLQPATEAVSPAASAADVRPAKKARFSATRKKPAASAEPTIIILDDE